MPKSQQQTVDTFKMELKNWRHKKVQKGARDVQHKVMWKAVEDLFELCNEAPIRTGHLMSGWKITYTAPFEGKMKLPKNRNKQKPIGNYAAQLKNTLNLLYTGPLKQQVYLKNTHPWFEFFEEGTFPYPNPGPAKEYYVDVLGRQRHDEIWIENGYSAYLPRGIIKVVAKDIAKRFKTVKANQW